MRTLILLISLSALAAGQTAADNPQLASAKAKEGKSENRGLEKSMHTKAEIVTALRDGFAYCDSVYSGLTDATSAAMVTFFGQKRTKLSMLSFNTAHSFEALWKPGYLPSDESHGSAIQRAAKIDDPDLAVNPDDSSRDCHTNCMCCRKGVAS